MLCVIAKNEKPYINEFVDYHLGLGFSKIVVYDNSENFELKEWTQTQARHLVQVISFPRPERQEGVYLDCARKAFNGDFGENKKWAAFFDVDKFLVLKQHENVDALLDEHLPVGSGSLSINWAMFQFNGHSYANAFLLPKDLSIVAAT